MTSCWAERYSYDRKKGSGKEKWTDFAYMFKNAVLETVTGGYLAKTSGQKLCFFT